MGPASNFTNVHLNVSYLATWATATPGVFARWSYTPVPCTVSIPHTQLLCSVLPGGGLNMAWTIVLDGQASTLPYTSYNAPAINAITLADGSTGLPAAGLPAVGGTTLMLLGSGFGPVDFFSGAAYSPLLSALTYGPTGVEYSAANFTVLS